MSFSIHKLEENKKMKREDKLMPSTINAIFFFLLNENFNLLFLANFQNLKSTFL
jgi:hypothetical protein